MVLSNKNEIDMWSTKIAALNEKIKMFASLK